MKTLAVNTSRPYEIQIERGALDRAGELCARALPRARKLAVVTDSTVEPLYLVRTGSSLKKAGFQVECFSVPAGEASKNAQQLARLWEQMMTFGMTRTDGVVALGGGVVGDLAGFAAATLLRGVDFVQIPTTLLSQVDSSVGGKVAIDLEHGKNLAGAFWQPRLVLMDPETLDTLSDPIFSDGMAEVIKYGCIFDKALFDFLAARPTRPQLMEEIEHILYTCCDLKRMVVEEDERDTGRRMLLNFGHTLGHAYELAGHYETWTHGQAVAAGMVMAAGLGERLGVTPAGTAGTVAGVLALLGLPTAIPCTPEEYAAAVGLDKKGAGADITLILLEEVGHAVPHKMSKQALLEEL